MFPSKVPINKCQATCPRRVAQARFQEHWTTEYCKVWRIVLITGGRDWRTSFASRCFYTQKLVHTEACTHRSFYTEKPLHTDVFPQKNRFHRAAFTQFKKTQFYVSFWRSAVIYRAKGLHPALKNRNFWCWTIILRERVAPDLVKSQFYTSCISRETVVPDVSTWIKSQFYTKSWTFASDV